MIRRPPNPHRTDHPFPYSPLSRSYQSNSRRGNSAQNVDSLYLPMLELVDGPGRGPRALTEEVQAQASLLDDRLDITAGFFYERNWSPHYQQSAVLLYGGYLGQAGNAVDRKSTRLNSSH